MFVACQHCHTCTKRKMRGQRQPSSGSWGWHSPFSASATCRSGRDWAVCWAGRSAYRCRSTASRSGRAGCVGRFRWSRTRFWDMSRGLRVGRVRLRSGVIVVSVWGLKSCSLRFLCANSGWLTEPSSLRANTDISAAILGSGRLLKLPGGPSVLPWAKPGISAGWMSRIGECWLHTI